jgi:hypothetical protein
MLYCYEAAEILKKMKAPVAQVDRARDS